MPLRIKAIPGDLRFGAQPFGKAERLRRGFPDKLVWDRRIFVKKKKACVIAAAGVAICAAAGTGFYFFMQQEDVPESPVLPEGMSLSEDVVSATGLTSVGMLEETYELGFLEDGLYVEETYLNMGDAVEEGTAVFKVSEESLESARRELEKQVQETALNRRQGAITYETGLLDAQKEKDLAAVEAAYAQSVYDNAVSEAQEEVDALQKKVDDAQEKVDEYTASIEEDYYYTYYGVAEKEATWKENAAFLMELYEDWNVEWLQDMYKGYENGTGYVTNQVTGSGGSSVSGQGGSSASSGSAQSGATGGMAEASGGYFSMETTSGVYFTEEQVRSVSEAGTDGNDAGGSEGSESGEGAGAGGDGTENGSTGTGSDGTESGSGSSTGGSEGAGEGGSGSAGTGSGGTESESGSGSEGAGESGTGSTGTGGDNTENGETGSGNESGGSQDSETGDEDAGEDNDDTGNAGGGMMPGGSGGMASGAEGFGGFGEFGGGMEGGAAEASDDSIRYNIYLSMEEETEESQQAYETALENYENARKTAEAGIEEAKSELAVLQAQLTEQQAAYEQAVITAKLTYDLAVSDNENAQMVYESSVKQLEEDYETLQEEEETAAENLALFEETIGDGIFYTSSAGTVMMTTVRASQWITEDTVVVAYSNPDTVTISASVAQEDIASVEIGEEAFVLVSGYGSYTGKVTSVNPVSASEGSSVSYTVNVRLEGDVSALEANLTAYVYLGLTEEEQEMLSGSAGSGRRADAESGMPGGEGGSVSGNGAPQDSEGLQNGGSDAAEDGRDGEADGTSGDGSGNRTGGFSGGGTDGFSGGGMPGGNDPGSGGGR